MKIFDELPKPQPDTAKTVATTPGSSDPQPQTRVAAMPVVEVNVDELLERYLTERSPVVSHTSAFRVR